MMTPKERVRVHIQIERENLRKLKEWQKGGVDHGERSEDKESA